MITLASIIDLFATDYLAQHGSSVLPSQRQALNVMKSGAAFLWPPQLPALPAL